MPTGLQALEELPRKCDRKELLMSWNTSALEPEELAGPHFFESVHVYRGPIPFVEHIVSKNWDAKTFRYSYASEVVPSIVRSSAVFPSKISESDRSADTLKEVRRRAVQARSMISSAQLLQIIRAIWEVR